MNVISTINRHCNAFKQAVYAAVQEKKNINSQHEAITLGDKIYENPDYEKIISELGNLPTEWHGTHYPLVAQQIENGQFEWQGKDIYSTRDIWVAQFYGEAQSNIQAHNTNSIADPVTLRIGSPAICGKNIYQQYYFDKSSNKPVYILEAYRKRKDHEEIASVASTALSMYQTAQDTYQKIINSE